MEPPKSARRATYQHTPPPSPGATLDAKVDTEGINDDIVTGVIEQLEKTGNRPHLIKELAAVLSTTSDSVARYFTLLHDSRQHTSGDGQANALSHDSSANPAALLSSRLSTYLRRPWTALAPCPLAKELIPIHPRKVYFYLTNTPRQDIPENSDDILGTIRGGGKGGKRVISPSLSNASVDEDEEMDLRKREALSPSPEVDLSTPELDENADDDIAPPTPAGSFSGRSSLARDGTNPQNEVRLVHNHRAASPPLEGDEREFTRTASSMRARGMSLDDSIRPSTEAPEHAESDAPSLPLEETAEMTEQRNKEAAATLFGNTHANHNADAMILSSPLTKQTHLHIITEASKLDMMDIDMKDQASALGDTRFGAGWDMRSPENVELDELDDLLGGF